MSREMDAKRVKIAKWMGWTKIYQRKDGDWDGLHPESESRGRFVAYQRLPNFPECLNAMSKAEDVVKERGLHKSYTDEVANGCSIHYPPNLVFRMITATAGQRAAALCRVIDALEGD